jgi:putative endonuclease
MLKNSIGKLYVGVTENPQKRVQYHNQKRGAQFTKYVPDYEVVFLEQYKSLSEARGREIQIKKWRRDKKELLIDKYKAGKETKLS